MHKHSDIQFPIVISNFPVSFPIFPLSFRAQREHPQMRMILQSRETCFPARTENVLDESRATQRPSRRSSAPQTMHMAPPFTLRTTREWARIVPSIGERTPAPREARTWYACTTIPVNAHPEMVVGCFTPTTARPGTCYASRMGLRSDEAGRSGPPVRSQVAGE